MGKDMGNVWGNRSPLYEWKPEQVVKKTTLDKFVRFGGYGIVKRNDNGSWRWISEASKRTGLSRPTIYQILKEYPKKPSKTLPKYVQEFEESEGYKRLYNFYRPRVSQHTWERTVRDVLKGWKVLNHKDPISWDEPDFIKLWNHEHFWDEEAKGFREGSASSFHKLMEQINRHELIPKFKGVKKALGKKKGWWLANTDLVTLIPCITKRIILVLTECGILSGARISALLALKVKDVHFQNQSVTVFEKKMRRKQPYVEKYPPLCLFQILKKWIQDENLGPEDRVFNISKSTYNKYLKEAGECAKLGKTLSSHILKHTFVTQGHRHKLSRETITEMCGTEDATIKRFYLDVNENRIRAETQGEQENTVPFYEWAESLHMAFRQKYANLNGDTLTRTKQQVEA